MSNPKVPNWLPIISLGGHIALAVLGVYKCPTPGCDGKLDVTFNCPSCGRRSLPQL